MELKIRYSLSRTLLWAASLAVLTVPVRGDVNFEELTCRGGPGLSTRIFKAKWTRPNIFFHYESSDMRRLLEAILPAGTPPELSWALFLHGAGF